MARNIYRDGGYNWAAWVGVLVVLFIVVAIFAFWGTTTDQELTMQQETPPVESTAPPATTTPPPAATTPAPRTETPAPQGGGTQ